MGITRLRRRGGLQDDVARAHGEVGWIISQNPPAHPDKALMARLVSTMPTPYVLLADTLADLQAMLPAGLERSDRQPTARPMSSRSGSLADAAGSKAWSGIRTMVDNASPRACAFLGRDVAAGLPVIAAWFANLI